MRPLLSHHRRPQRLRGFSMTELVVTMVIVAILAAMATIATSSLARVAAVREDARLIKSWLEDARSRAVLTSAYAGVTVVLYGTASSPDQANGNLQVWHTAWEPTAGIPCPPAANRIVRNRDKTTRMADGMGRSLVRVVNSTGTDLNHDRLHVFFDSLLRTYACTCTVTVSGTTVTEGSCSSLTVGSGTTDSLLLQVKARATSGGTDTSTIRTINIRGLGTVEIL